MENKKVQFYKICKVTCMIMLVAFIGMFFGKNAEAAEKRLSSITAVYTGDAILVGQSIPMDKVTVMGLYSDGSYKKVEGFVLSSYVVTQAGNNEIRVSCEGVTGTFTVMGKKIVSLNAFYEQASVTIGESLDKEKLNVQVFFSDGSSEQPKEYTLSHTLVSALGRNEFVLTYEGMTARFYVTGKEEKKPKSIYATYNGPAVIVGNAPKREDFYVNVFFNDNTSEKITAFELTPSVVQKEGSNVVIVSYGDLSTEVKITGLAKTVTSITAEYVGFPVIIGKTVANEDIKVTATFNDGSKDTVTNFTLSSSVVYTIGPNVITVFCGEAMAYITVRGVEAEIVNYGNSAQATIADGTIETKVALAVGAKANPKDVQIEKIDKALVKKAMRRLVQSDKYVAFEVAFIDPELDVFLPMTMKVTVPKGYDKDNFAVYYTPNRKTIMAKMNGEFLADGTYEFKMFQPGTYIVADCTPRIYVENVLINEENLSLRVGRSYSLKPMVLPHEATNQEVKYSSSRPQIVSVSEDGILEAQKVGTAIIKIEATDGSGKSCKLRVNVVEKKGKFDEEISEWADRMEEIETAEDFLYFYFEWVMDIQEKSYEMSEKELKQYTEELLDWVDTWDENTIALDEYEMEVLGETMFGWFEDWIDTWDADLDKLREEDWEVLEEIVEEWYRGWLEDTMFAYDIEVDEESWGLIAEMVVESFREAFTAMEESYDW